MRRLTLLTGFAMLAAAAPASAAIEIGQATPAGGPQATCGTENTRLQSSSGAVPTYNVPSGSWVITGWRHRAGMAAGTQRIGLRAYRRDPVDASRYQTVAASPIETPTPGADNTFAVGPPGLPVQEGDVIGLRSASNGNVNCVWQTGFTGDGYRFSTEDPPVGSSLSYSAENAGYRVNVSAMLEPDADRDGLGDETQDSDDDNDGVPDASDNCPGTASADTTDLDSDGRGAPCDADDDIAAPTVALSGFATLKRRAFVRRGVRGTVTPSEPAAFDIALIGTLKGSRVARAGDVVLAERALASAPGTRSVTLKVTRRLRPRLARRLRLTLRIAATDAAGNRALVTRRIRVR